MKDLTQSFEGHIVVNSGKLEEHTTSTKTYVAMPNFDPTSYMIEFEEPTGESQVQGGNSTTPNTVYIPQSDSFSPSTFSSLFPKSEDVTLEPLYHSPRLTHLSSLFSNSQMWPVTPYTIRVQSLGGRTCFAELRVDGQKVKQCGCDQPSTQCLIF